MEGVGQLKIEAPVIPTSEIIAELELPIQNILTQIQDRIDKREYGIIIGEDASGRIPGLIFGKFLKRLYETGEMSGKKVDHPETIFIPGKLEVLDNLRLAKISLRKHLTKHGLEKGKRILIATDTIASGESLKILTDLIKSLGFKVDIASIGVFPFMPDKTIRKNLGDSVISGDYIRRNSQSLPTRTPHIYNNKSISGVYKVSGETVSKSYKLKSYLSDEIKKKIQRTINESRTEVDVLVDKLVDWYKTQGKEKS